MRFYVSAPTSGTTSSNHRDWQAMRIYLGDADGRGGKDMQALGKREKLKRPLRILLSWHYYRDDDIDALLDKCFGDLDVELDVFADSGAFSAWSVGKQIDPVDYTKWVQRYAHRFTAAAGPDVIGDAEATHKSTTEMLKHVTTIPVLPTFHVGEDWDWLDQCCQLSDYIALGGMVPYTRRKKLLTAWLAKAYGKIPKEHRVHGFGLTTWPLLIQFPWYSVDSSSWTAGFRYAALQLFDQQQGKFVQVDMRQGRQLLRYRSLLESYGLRAGKTRASDYDRDLLCGACLESWQRAEAWLCRKRATKLYTVGGNFPSAPNHPTGIRKGVDAYDERGGR